MKYCSCVYKKNLPSELPRRMPYKKNTQVARTLIPQDKEGFGSFISHEENM
jgi:hypothetical protein